MKTDDFILHPSSFILSLADGARLALRAGDEDAACVVSFFGKAARLTMATAPLPSDTRRLMVVTDVGQIANLPYADVVCVLEPPGVLRPRHPRPDAAAGGPRFVFEPLTEEQWFWQQLVRLSACIAQQTLPRGGVLLHSGLALTPTPLLPPSPLPNLGEGKGGRGGWGEGGGVLLAGRSGVGKSTASARLPHPWRALSDDATLVVCDGQGTYWAHPWPTWSRFFGDEAGDGSDTWDVQRAVPLRAIFVLEQGEEDRVEPLGPGHTLALLAELARQTSTHLIRGWPLDEMAAFHRQRFENLCALVRAVPAYTLYVSLNGAFWEEMERAISQEPD